jgi:anaerobic selenocysteine-containing dehydrogenase
MTDDELVATSFASNAVGAGVQAELREHGVASPPAGPRLIPFVDVFPDTPDQKIHLVPHALDVAAGGLYTYRDDPGTNAYPLAMISPALATQVSSTFGQLRRAPGTLEISVHDAAARGIANGDDIRVFNEHGEVHCIAKVSTEVANGVCVMPKGLWRKHTANGLTANALIPQTFADLGGQAAYNDARVEVAKR